MKIVDTPLGEIRPYGRNAKKHDAKQVANVAESIRQYGFVQPIVVDGDGVIVIGHCRYAAAKELGMATVPVVRVDELTPEQVDALRIVDNKTNESPWDLELLMEDLPRLDLDAFDFDFALPEIKSEAEVRKRMAANTRVLRTTFLLPLRTNRRRWTKQPSRPAAAATYGSSGGTG